ncbi:type I DNA topoisomerase [bacterium]|nr:type I DNA topoisomerase [bacterium]
MKKSLVIVESPSKAKTINKYLGNDYVVTSSVGHIRDLPQKELGVDIENGFKPKYVTSVGKTKVISQIKELAEKCDKIFIATDNDREGEAIGWHVAHVVEKVNGNIFRVLFNEITKNAINSAILKPTKIDENRVNAQQARRILDRIVGYQVSPFLWKTISKGLSAGRVQSVALRIIVERDLEIEKFKPVEYWSITAKLLTQTDKFPFEAKLVKINSQTLDTDKNRIEDGKGAEFHKNEILKHDFIVSGIEKKAVKRNPNPPFITSTLQQEGAKRLRFSSKQTMAIAQQLYEGFEVGTGTPTGLITYMRTDSLRISQEAISAVRDTILAKYGKDFLPEKPNYYKSSSSAQEAHEAIRPTSMDLAPEKIKSYLTKEQFRLYEMVWNRFVASQMASAIEDRTTVNINASENYLFRTVGSVLRFKGFLAAFEDFEEDEQTENQNPKLPPSLKEGNLLNLKELVTSQHFTKPPAFFSESSLIKELDALGIGRPSTYASIISTILERGYIEKQEKKLVSTELGKLVTSILVETLNDVFNVKFTAEMETELDKIENGSNWVKILENFYKPFSASLEKANPKELKKEKVHEAVGEKCPDCGSELLYKMSRNGKFIACSNFPKCRYARPLGTSAKEFEDKKTEKKEAELVGKICEKCGKDLVFRSGKNGRFIGCSNYPKCNFTAQLPSETDCPKCGRKVVSKRSKRGKNFYGCENYPECDFVSWDKVINETCKNCGNSYLTEKVTKDGTFVECPQCKTKNT